MPCACFQMQLRNREKSPAKGHPAFHHPALGKNRQAIRAYEKAGFKRVPDKDAAIQAYLRSDYLEAYGPGDYGFDQTAVLTCEP